MDSILTALKYIDVKAVSYQEWINVGMALKSEGFSVDVWDSWSRGDSRYHPGECERKWQTFNGSSSPIQGGTIVQMAKSYGYDPFTAKAMTWSDTIYDDGDGFTAYNEPAENTPTEELITYIETLFEKDDCVGYVTSEVWQNEDGKWLPKAGIYTRTAGEIIQDLRKYKDDIGAAIGDWKKDAGAWIRFNALDGKGVKNDNVTKFKYALVESDEMSISDQDAMLRKYELPIAALVHSGGKSLHAIVKIDAKDFTEYRKRVEFLYDFLEKQGMQIDRQNRNPSRLSRMPGITRGSNRQYLVGTNIGRSSWDSWMDYVEGIEDELPPLESLSDAFSKEIELPKELIKGILRCGHKMLISGSSKAGKSFLLMELCICIAEGKPWLGFDVMKGRVLYVNLEIDPSSCINRFKEIYKAMGIKETHAEDIAVWNLRGKALPLDKLIKKLIRRAKQQHFDAIIIDPIYKVITGDENSASDMAYFCNLFDRICAETGCSTIYCHHHSKGAQGFKRAMDRASGSGVFARDPDAQLDIIELELTDAQKNWEADGNATAWRLESSLREFKNIKPVNFWFKYPVHKLDDTGQLAETPAQGTKEAGLIKSGKYSTEETRQGDLDRAFMLLSMGAKEVTVSNVAQYLGKSERTVRDYVKESSGRYKCDKGIIRLVPNEM